MLLLKFQCVFPQVAQAGYMSSSLNVETGSIKTNIIHAPYANMADHSVVLWNELYESEASWASVFCFDNASSEKCCFVRDLVFFISLRLRVFMFLNATRRDRNCPTFASKGKKWIHAIH